MSESEIVLLQRVARTGDAEAFSEIVGRYAGMVYSAAIRVLADADRAADATQDTFFDLMQHASEITGSVGGWLHRVATRKAIDRIRRDSARRSREAQYAAGQARWRSGNGRISRRTSTRRSINWTTRRGRFLWSIFFMRKR